MGHRRKKVVKMYKVSVEPKADSVIEIISDALDSGKVMCSVPVDT